MSKKIFNPNDWADKTKNKTSAITPLSCGEGLGGEVDTIVNRIESAAIDIAPNYADWRDLGFALADALGESGRHYYHRLSRFYSGYTEIETNKQFDNCRKSKGHGVTIKTLYHLAKFAGVDISVPHAKRNNSKGEKLSNTVSPLPKGEGRGGASLPTFPENIYTHLPAFLQKVVAVAATNEEKDLLLLGTITVVSACFPDLFGIYDNRKVYANLFLFVTAQASAGKGKLVHCKQIVKPIHQELRQQAKLLKQDYECSLTEYNANKSKDSNIEKPEKPQEKMLFIPANSSATGVFQLLFDNDGSGLIFETEGDTLAQSFKSDYGNYSDGLRKSFHHETISYYRCTDREYVDIEKPRLSVLLSGTPKQIAYLIPNAENGLFSRFVFYYMNFTPVWKNVFATQADSDLDDYFNRLGNEFYQLYQCFNHKKEIECKLTSEQIEQFNRFFAERQNRYFATQPDDFMATVRRLGLITFRICMILSALRVLETGDISNPLICTQTDFDTALEIVKVLFQHADKVFSDLPEETKPAKLKNRKEKFLEALPQNFNRQQYLEIARQFEIPDKTAEGYIKNFCDSGFIHREHQDHYINRTIAEIKETKEVKD